MKTKVQQRALAGEPSKSVWETFRRLIRGTKAQNPPFFFFTTTADLWGKYHVGPDPKAPKPILLGIARIYRGLGVSALRSVTTHGLLWTFFDLTASYIDGLPRPNQADLEPR